MEEYLKCPENNKTKIINHINKLIRKLKRENDVNKISEYKNDIRKLFNAVEPYVNDSEEVFVVPLVTPEIFISKSVALVGNSKKVLRQLHGEDIDKHTNVIRFNYAITKGYEKYVGSKETMRLCIKNLLTCKKYKNHPPGLVRDYKILRKLNNVKITIFYKGPKVNFSSIARRNNINLKSNSLHCIPWNRDRFTKFVRSQFDKDPQCGFGMMLLITLIGIKPDLYGFDTKICSDNLGYYWNNKVKHTQRSPHHNISTEHKLLNKFNKKKIINIH